MPLPTKFYPHSPNKLAPALAQWSNQDLQNLIEIAQGLLESRNQPPEPEPAECRSDGSPKGKRGGRGSIELKMINGCDPYRYLRYWGETKKGKRGLKSVYLGKLLNND